jgi:hypothetical protein
MAVVSMAGVADVTGNGMSQRLELVEISRMDEWRGIPCCAKVRFYFNLNARGLFELEC